MVRRAHVHVQYFIFCASTVCLFRFVWFEIAKLCDTISLAVIGLFGQFKKFCNGLEEEKRMIERFNVTNHHHHFQ